MTVRRPIKFKPSPAFTYSDKETIQNLVTLFKYLPLIHYETYHAKYKNKILGTHHVHACKMTVCEDNGIRGIRNRKQERKGHTQGRGNQYVQRVDSNCLSLTKIICDESSPKK